MSRYWPEDNPTCALCGGAGEKVRHGVWRHLIPFGGDGVGPRSHGFTVDEQWIEADRRHKEKIEAMRHARIPGEEQHYLEMIGAEDVARRSKLEKEWREWENADVAQSVARDHAKVEVSGLNPVIHSDECGPSYLRLWSEWSAWGKSLGGEE